MAKLLDVVEGWTDELGPFTLKADGVAVDLTGLTVELILTDKTRTQVTIDPANVRIDGTPTTGKVYFTPEDEQLLNSLSPYYIRWQVTDDDGEVVFFPNAGADTIVVHRP